MVRTLGILAVAALLLAPATSSAIGVSLSAGAGVVTPNSDFRTAFELTPFYEVSVLRFEVPVEMQVKPGTSFAVRPGLKLFLPLMGIYARGGYGLGNIGKDGGLTHAVVLGVGWELALLDTVGVFFEGTGEPALKPGGTFAAMLRAGAMVNF